MSGADAALLAAGGLLAAYLLLVIALVVLGRREWARALAGFVPDCAVLIARLARDPRARRSQKLLAGALLVYLALPLDLVPDFLPVVGQLDDLLVVAAVLRVLLRTVDVRTIHEHWPGPPQGLALVMRAAGVRPSGPTPA